MYKVWLRTDGFGLAQLVQSLWRYIINQIYTGHCVNGLEILPEPGEFLGIDRYTDQVIRRHDDQAALDIFGLIDRLWMR